MGTKRNFNNVKSIKKYFGFCIKKALVGLISVAFLANCIDTNEGTNITPFSIPTKQPDPFLRQMPQEPHIFVSFSGLNESAIVYTYFRTLTGNLPVWGSRPGNGEKKVVLPERQGEIYVVTAESEGYVSEPISYTIQLSGTRFYLVENGQTTTKEATNLKFDFTPEITPTED